MTLIEQQLATMNGTTPPPIVNYQGQLDMYVTGYMNEKKQKM